MINVVQEWNKNQAVLKDIILKQDKFPQAINLCLDMHRMVHISEMSNNHNTTYEDQLWEGMSSKAFVTQIKSKGATIAWNLWHLARIEDITTNILIADDVQVFNSDNWFERMNVSICDTGNAMSDQEIAEFSSQINMAELKSYRLQVGRKTRRIISNLKPEHMKLKIKPESVRRILEEGGVTEADDSKWLLDFWGRKNVAGILLMPVTRHQIVHLNNSFKIKKWYTSNLKP